jgi:hypothetical protein
MGEGAAIASGWRVRSAALSIWTSTVRLRRSRTRLLAPTKGRYALLGRKNYNQEELDHAKSAISQQLSAYKKLVKAIDNGEADPEAASALEAFEPLFCNNLALVLDRYFVHRLRVVTGKDGNPLNELELLSDSLINNDAVLRGNNVIKLIPAQSVLKLEIGDDIRLSAPQFERLAKAFFDEIEAKFVEPVSALG